jgi:acyl-coenzyme A synthetase/AMP-(fatty) acid ligase
VCRDHLAETMIAEANRRAATLIYASPLHYQRLAAEPTGLRLETVKRAISTSTGLAAGTAEAFLQRFGIPLTQAYGIIEIGLPLINLDGAHENPLSIGAPLPDYEAALLDERGEPVPDGDEGELAIRGPGMFSAYLNPPTPREAALVRGWFMTGDLARRDPDGRLTVVGRKKALIIVGGQKVFPEEVEAVLNAHPAVLASRVYGKPHPRMGEAPEAELVPRPGVARPDVEELIAWCEKRLSGLKVPQKIHFVESISETLSGKIARGRRGPASPHSKPL